MTSQIENTLNILEEKLKNLKKTEIILLLVLFFMGIIYLFQNNIYTPLSKDIQQNEIKFNEILYKQNNAKKITKQKSISQIRAKNNELKSQIATLDISINENKKILDDVYKFKFDNLKCIYNQEELLDGKLQVTFFGGLDDTLYDIDELNKRYKIEKITTLVNKKYGLQTIAILNSHLINKPWLKELKNTRVSFLNNENILNLTSIIGNTARINKKWYQKDENISDRIKIINIYTNKVTIKDSKNKIKTLLLN